MERAWGSRAERAPAGAASAYISRHRRSPGRGLGAGNRAAL